MPEENKDDPSQVKKMLQKTDIFSKLKVGAIKQYLVGLLSVSIILLSIFFLIIPQYRVYQKLQLERVAVDLELKTISAHTEYLQNLYSLRDRLDTNLEIASQALSISKDKIPLILDQLLQIAENSGVQVQAQSLSGIVEPEDLLTPVQIKIQMDIVGEKSTILSFIKALEDMRNLTDVEFFTLSYFLEEKTAQEKQDESEEGVVDILPTTQKFLFKTNLISYYMQDANVDNLAIEDIVDRPGFEDIIDHLEKMQYYEPRESNIQIGKLNPFVFDETQGIQEP